MTAEILKGISEPDSPVSSAPENGQLLFIRSAASRRDTQTTGGSANLESGSSQPLVSSGSSSQPHTYTMTSGEFTGSTPVFAQRSKRNMFYKILCFVVLALQGGMLDFYLIVFTDLYWCSWIATDLVVVSGWAMFFVKNARSRRERACGFHQKSSIFGCNLGEFSFAYLAWLIYVIATAPKVVLVLETSILDLIAIKVPLGVTGFKVTALMCVPLLYCLINSVVQDPNGATRFHSQSCFASTCLDVIDSFSLVELLLSGGIPDVCLRYTVVSAYLVSLSAPVLWLCELTASEMNCRWIGARLFSGVMLNAPLLVVRCFLVLVREQRASLFMLKNVFVLACKMLEMLEQCVSLRGDGRGEPAARFSHCASENDMCPHGYVNTLAVNTQT